MNFNKGLWFALAVMSSANCLANEEISEADKSVQLTDKEQKTLERGVDSYRVNVLKNLYIENSNNGLIGVDQSYLMEEPLTIDEVADFKHPYLNVMVSQLTEKERDEIIKSVVEETAKQNRYQSIFNTAMKYAMSSGFYAETRLYFQDLKDERFHDMSSIFPFYALMIEEGKIRPPLIEEISFSSTIEDKRTRRDIKRRFRIAEQSEVVLDAPTFMDEFNNLLTKKPKEPSIYMLPINEDELEYWHKGAINGWVQGVKMAHQVIRADLRLLARRSLGYIRFFTLADRGTISMPDSQNIQVGTNSRGDVVNIGESIFEITKLPELNDDEQNWIAIPQVDDIFDELTEDDVNALTEQLYHFGDL